MSNERFVDYMRGLLDGCEGGLTESQVNALRAKLDEIDEWKRAMEEPEPDFRGYHVTYVYAPEGEPADNVIWRPCQ